MTAPNDRVRFSRFASAFSLLDICVGRWTTPWASGDHDDATASSTSTRTSTDCCNDGGDSNDYPLYCLPRRPVTLLLDFLARRPTTANYYTNYTHYTHNFCYFRFPTNHFSSRQLLIGGCNWIVRHGGAPSVAAAATTARATAATCCSGGRRPGAVRKCSSSASKDGSHRQNQLRHRRRHRRRLRSLRRPLQRLRRQQPINPPAEAALEASAAARPATSSSAPRTWLRRPSSSSWTWSSSAPISSSSPHSPQDQVGSYIYITYSPLLSFI